MADPLNIGVSGLLAAQRNVATTNHNIANANTEGYSRQRVGQEARLPQASGSGFIGKGVDVSTVRRLADNFLNKQLENTLSSEGKFAAYAEYARFVEGIVASENAGVAPAMTAFFDALQDVNNDPNSSSARTVLLGAAEALSARFNEQAAQLAELERGLNAEIRSQVAEVNALTSQIADINRKIVEARGIGGNQPANDLLDQREQAVRQLAELTGVQTVEQTDGTLSVFIGVGLPVVNGPLSYALSTQQNPNDSTRTEITYGAGASQTIVSDGLGRGRLAGLVDVRDEVIGSARNQIGRLAVAFSETLNAQHNEGLDLNGALGGDLFSVGGPNVINPGNAGAAALTVQIDPATLGDLQPTDYQLRFDGTTYTLENLTTGATTDLSGLGFTPGTPLSVAGLRLDLDTPMTAGDSFRIQPYRYAAVRMQTEISDPNLIAVAAPVRSQAALANVGSAEITQPTVTDVNNANLQSTVTIEFTSPNAYSIDGGAAQPYTSGDDIDINGWRLSISGTPVAGDTFTVQSNVGGTGDNRNGLLLADIQQTDILNGGTTSLKEGYAEIVGNIGAKTRSANLSLSSVSVLRENAEVAQAEVSGVNLDEEAANLLRFQQAYNASAQVIQISNQLFESLLAAVRS